MVMLTLRRHVVVLVLVPDDVDLPSTGFERWQLQGSWILVVRRSVDLCEWGGGQKISKSVWSKGQEKKKKKKKTR
jgi:hypothetical protein